MILFNVMTSPGPEQPRLPPLTDISVIVSTPLQPRQLSARPPHYVQAEAEWHVSNASRAIISMVFGPTAETARLLSFLITLLQQINFSDDEAYVENTLNFTNSSSTVLGISERNVILEDR